MTTDDVIGAVLVALLFGAIALFFWTARNIR